MHSAEAPPGRALHALYSDHHGWLTRWLRHKLGSDDDAAELAQDTFLRLMLAKLPEGLREPRAFLTEVAHGLVVNHWRRLEIERAYLAALAARPQPLAPSPEQRAQIIETLCEVDEMLMRLNPKARQAFLLAQLDGLTYKEIGAQLQVSERMVKKYMAQAMLQCLLVELPETD